MQPYTFPSKFPAEKITGLYFDFANHLSEGETIQSATVTSVPALSSNVQHLGSVVSWDMAGGTSGTTVAITVVATGTQGSIREVQGKMAIIAPAT
jgi:hypothetical protein